MRWPWVSRTTLEREQVMYLAQKTLDGEVIEASRTRRVAAELELHRVKTLAAERLRHIREAEDRADTAEQRLDAERAKWREQEHHDFGKLCNVLRSLSGSIRDSFHRPIDTLLVSPTDFVEIDSYIRRHTDVFTMARHGGEVKKLIGITLAVDSERQGSIILTPKIEEPSS